VCDRDSTSRSSQIPTSNKARMDRYQSGFGRESCLSEGYEEEGSTL